MNTKTLIASLAALLAVSAAASAETPAARAATSTAATTATAAATSTATASKPLIISVRQALTAPDDYNGKRVLLSGVFMGNNGSCDKLKRPVDSSDVMVQDKSGLCIYASGPIPDSFDMLSDKGVGKIITVSGFVKKPEKGGHPFFLIPPPPNYNPALKKNSSTNPARKFAALKAHRKTITYTIEQVMAKPEKFAISSDMITVTGIFESACPGAQQPENSWALIGAGRKDCLTILGAQPDDNSVKAGTSGVRYSSATGSLKKQPDGGFALVLPPSKDKEK